MVIDLKEHACIPDTKQQRVQLWPCTISPCVSPFSLQRSLWPHTSTHSHLPVEYQVSTSPAQALQVRAVPSHSEGQKCLPTLLDWDDRDIIDRQWTQSVFKALPTKKKWNIARVLVLYMLRVLVLYMLRVLVLYMLRVLVLYMLINYLVSARPIGRNFSVSIVTFMFSFVAVGYRCSERKSNSIWSLFYGEVNATKYNFKRTVEGKAEREMGSEDLAETWKPPTPPPPPPGPCPSTVCLELF